MQRLSKNVKITKLGMPNCQMPLSSAIIQSDLSGQRSSVVEQRFRNSRLEVTTGSFSFKTVFCGLRSQSQNIVW
jgi:hypothetical protein